MSSRVVQVALLALVASSKHVIIYNEELLVLLSFIGFLVVSSKMMTDSVTEALEARRHVWHSEFRELVQTQQVLTRCLLLEHGTSGAHPLLQKMWLRVGHTLHMIDSSVEASTRGRIIPRYTRGLEAIVANARTSKATLQTAIANNFRRTVVDTLAFSSGVSQSSVASSGTSTTRLLLSEAFSSNTKTTK